MLKFAADPARTGGAPDSDALDLDRRSQDIVKFGEVTEVDRDRDPPSYRVLIGDRNDDDNHIVTDWLPAGGARASGDGDTETHFLEVGEKVVLLAEGGDLATAQVMPAGTYTRENKPATRKAGEWRRQFKNGAVVGYDRETGELTLDATNATGKVTIRSKDGVVRMSGGKVTVMTGAKARSTGPTSGNSGATIAALAAEVFDLNNQLKGLHARIEQTEHTLSAQHFVTSLMRQILLFRNPGLSALGAFLSPNPGSLEKMTRHVTGLLPGYARSFLKMGMGKFQVPTLASIGAGFGSFLEATVGELESQIVSGKAEKKRIEEEVEKLREKIEDIRNDPVWSGPKDKTGLTDGEEGLPTADEEIKKIELQIVDLLASPIFTLLPELEGELSDLLRDLPAASGFMDSQGNIVKGVIESVRFGGLGPQP